MGLAQDLLDLFQRMEDRRRPMEVLWRKVDELVPPITRSESIGYAQNDMNGLTNNIATRRQSKSVKRYDTTMMQASSRLASGIFSLICPQSEKWHTLSVATAIDMADDEEKRWAELVRDVLFFNRYSPISRFQASMQNVLLSTVYYGPGYLYIEPSFNASTAMRYQFMPPDECFILKDDFGVPDVFAQRKSVSARNAVKRGWDVSEKVRADAEDPKKATTETEYVKIILERDDVGFRKMNLRGNTPWVCYTIDRGAQKIVQEDGFETFPVATFFWDDGIGEYGTSPCIDYMADQRMLNGMERDVLVAIQQAVRPPMGVHDESLMNRPDMNPGAVNPGAVSADGKQLMIPLTNGANPERAVPFMEQRRNHLRDGLYNTLFQSLVENPGQTATEVLTRSQEKAQLLGPVGARMHSGLDMMIEREMEALEMRGMYQPGSELLPPESIQDKDIRPKYTNPMARLQTAGQAEGVMRMMEIDNVRAQMGKPSILKDHETGRFLAEAFNAPLSLVKTDDELQQEMQAEQQQQQETQAVNSTRQAAAAAKDALPVLEAAGVVQS